MCVCVNLIHADGSKEVTLKDMKDFLFTNTINVLILFIKKNSSPLGFMQMLVKV